jgi:uroporphyrin-III C-methyltransferase
MSDNPADTGHPPASTPAPAARAAAPWLVPLNLVLLAGVLLLALLLLQQRSAMAVLSGDASAQTQRNAQIEQRLAAAESARTALAEQVQTLLVDSRDNVDQADVAVLQRELEALRRSVAQSTPQRDLLLAEAQGLLRLAGQQTLHGGAVASAISLYESADNLLQQIAEPAVQPARAALQLELDALRAVELPQLAALYLQLGELAVQLDALQVQSEGEGPLRFVAPEAVAAPVNSGWWAQARQLLGEYFVVTRQDAPLLARLTPDQAFLVRQAIRLQLESARLALLQGDQRLYQAALDAVHEGVTQQLQGSNKLALLAGLQRLRAERITAQLPALGSALRALELLQAAAAQGYGAPNP